jgi:hypothetical protein
MPAWIWRNPEDNFMTFEQFVKEYVCQKCEYSNKEVQEWLKEFNLTLDSRVIFVETGHFKDAVRIHEGYLLTPSARVFKQGRIRYLFVSKYTGQLNYYNKGAWQRQKLQ